MQQPLQWGSLRSPAHFKKKRKNTQKTKPTKQKNLHKNKLRNGLSETDTWFCSSVERVAAHGVTSQFSGAVLHISNKGRFLEDDDAVFSMDNPSSQVIFKHRAVGVLRDQMHIPLCLVFKLVRPFSKGHKGFI